MGRWSSFKPVKKYFFLSPSRNEISSLTLGSRLSCLLSLNDVQSFNVARWKDFLPHSEYKETMSVKYLKNFREQTIHPFTIQCLIFVEIIRRWGTWRSFVYVFCTAKVYCIAEDQ
jgi:hypothetical protein